MKIMGVAYLLETRYLEIKSIEKEWMKFITKKVMYHFRKEGVT
jgi:hypothetical protein